MLPRPRYGADSTLSNRRSFPAAALALSGRAFVLVAASAPSTRRSFSRGSGPFDAALIFWRGLGAVDATFFLARPWPFDAALIFRCGLGAVDATFFLAPLWPLRRGVRSPARPRRDRPSGRVAAQPRTPSTLPSSTRRPFPARPLPVRPGLRSPTQPTPCGPAFVARHGLKRCGAALPFSTWWSFPARPWRNRPSIPFPGATQTLSTSSLPRGVRFPRPQPLWRGRALFDAASVPRRPDRFYAALIFRRDPGAIGPASVYGAALTFAARRHFPTRPNPSARPRPFRCSLAPSPQRSFLGAAPTPSPPGATSPRFEAAFVPWRGPTAFISRPCSARVLVFRRACLIRAACRHHEIAPICRGVAFLTRTRPPGAACLA
ncbi:hypothetical protein L083_6972 [Actinoplanes sp. N902-109]|nr:hypothetical protein L083_6972 [Actinoplanes sp. N902-109]